jgi:uncharacterized protein (TIGR02246 family)
MHDDLNPMQQFMDRYQAAVLAKDADAFAALYDDDVHVFDMWGAWSLQGIAAWRAMAADWFASLGEERVVVEVQDMRCTQTDDMALGHAVLTFTALSADGAKLRSLNNRISVGLKRQGASWKVFHEHTSAPLDPQTTKGMLSYARAG